LTPLEGRRFDDDGDVGLFEDNDDDSQNEDNQ